MDPEYQKYLEIKIMFQKMYNNIYKSQKYIQIQISYLPTDSDIVISV